MRVRRGGSDPDSLTRLNPMMFGSVVSKKVHMLFLNISPTSYCFHQLRSLSGLGREDLKVLRDVLIHLESSRNRDGSFLFNGMYLYSIFCLG